MHVKPEEKYPLSENERNLLLNEMLGSGAVFILLGIILAVTYTGLRTGDWLAVFAHFTWAVDFSQAMTLGSNPLVGVGLALVLPVAFLAIEIVREKLMWAKSEQYRKEAYEMRRSFTGEIPRLGVCNMAITAAVAGFAEEFCFRYGAIGVLTVLLEGLFDFRFAMALAIVLTSLAFVSAHVQYGKLWEKMVVGFFAIVVGVVYVITGSLLVVAVIHALYDFLAELWSCRQMVREEDYFGGQDAPDGIIGAQIKELREMLRSRNKRD